MTSPKILLQSFASGCAGLFRGPRAVAAPEKELRFTRARQACTFVVIGIIFFCAALALFMLALPGFTGKQRPLVSSYWFAMIPLPLCAAAFWMAMRLTRHAYIILTPLGIEIFPFFRPEKNMQLLYWSEIEEAKISSDLRLLTVSHSGGSKAFVSLDPLRKNRLPLLKRAVEGTLAQLAPPSKKQPPGQISDN
ncbi:MAG: hypothetical protein KDN22_34405 [Verrucomicrobiae bacterium]|nr:hypothetical protein [Verrucomicrobiae bacterium]